MNRVLVISDLHLDHWEQEKRDPLAVVADLLKGLAGVIIAGDLSNKPQRRWTRFLERLREFVGEDVEIEIVPGNHDYYDYRLDAEDRLQQFAEAAGANFAQTKVVVFGDTRFLCATLWTDYDVENAWTYADRNQRTYSNDFRYIRVARGGYRRMRVDDVQIVHRQHRQWLESELAKPWDGRTVMVTHHLPHPSLLPPAKGDLSDPKRMLSDIEMPGKYASDLSHLFEGNTAPDMAVYGHSHDASDGVIGRTQLRSVSLGYPCDFNTDAEIRARFERAIFEVGPAPELRP